MKLKNLMLTGVSLLTASLLFSCSEDKEFVKFPSSDSAGEWTATVQIPDAIRTRAAAQGSVGSDGLYSFTRPIDRLWYAVYYDDAYLYDSESEAAPQPVLNSDGNFTLSFNVDNGADPSKMYLFFWAGNNQDNVTTDDVTSVTDGINLNFAKRCVSVDPKYMNGNNERLEEFDSFSGYVQLATSSSDVNKSLSVTLHRPFAQIHILSDEFLTPGVSKDFPDGVTVVPGYGSANATTANYASNLLSPTTWFFDDEIGGSDYKKNEFIYSQTPYQFTNTLSGSSTERVSFKNRNMDYLGCYYVFAPVEKAEMKSAAKEGATTYGKLNLAFYPKNGNIANAEFASVSLPEGGLKANNKYVIYNKPVDYSGNLGNGDDDDPTEGGETGSGFLSTSFLWDVIIDDIWGDNEEITPKVCTCKKEKDFSQVAWGVPLKETENPNWGRIGNLALWNAYKAKIGRYLMSGDGKAAKLNTENSGLWPDGTEVDESKGNVMVIAPNLYYFVQSTECDEGCTCSQCQHDYPILWMSESPISDKRIGGDNDYIVIGAYMGSMSDIYLVSRSGLNPQVSTTIAQYWDAAQLNGSDWGITNWDQVRFMMMLGLSEYGSPNIQANLGCGLSGSGSSNGSKAFKLQTGATQSLGDTNDKIDVKLNTEPNASWVSLFGIENPYSWFYHMIQGIYFGNKNNPDQNGLEVFIYEGNRIPSDEELKTHPEGNYRQITRAWTQGYIYNMYIGEYFDMIPSYCKSAGSSSIYWTDTYSVDDTGQLCLWGGAAVGGFGASGLFYMSTKDEYTLSSSLCGARLAYYGPVNFVDPEYFKD